MKKLFVISFLFLFGSTLFSNGVGIVNKSQPLYLQLVNTHVSVYVENQVSIVTTTQEFFNNLEMDTTVQYAFPLPDGASGTNLRWKINGIWHEALIAPTGNDTTGGGGSGPQPHASLLQYLGATPLYFSIPEQLLADSTLIVELSYVQLLPYSFGNVIFNYPNRYTLIQTQPVMEQKLDFVLISERTIDSIKCTSHPSSVISNNGDTAEVHINLSQAVADSNYKIVYSLSLSELGLYSFSTFLDDSASIADTISGGYFIFIVEPEPSAQVINKVFTLIVDRSGSMSGTKIVQAKNAASFIVQHLNTGDKFNIIDFATTVSSFRPSHIDYTPENEVAALSYISGFVASGNTNISGAFGTALPQFVTSNDSTANIIIFLTDGQPTTGLTNTQQILNYVDSLVTQLEATIMLNTFGIGSDVNVQLLTLLAANNNGLAEFLGNDQLESRITEFYLKIRNPVLLNTQMVFTPNVLYEVYPDPMPNLYIGQQMLAAGRYDEAPPVSLTFSGTRYGQPVQYNYQLELVDTSIADYQFIPKVWAKKKIENLLVTYYSLNPNTPQAIALKNQIIWLSIKYGVLSPFTTFVAQIPVELVSFSATLTGKTVELVWETASETNNLGFEIQRKFGEAEWTTIAQISGYGSSTETRRYSYVDDLSELNYKGKIYYRLKQIDFDGSYDFSEIVEVYFDALPDDYSLLQNYPNPFNPSTTIAYLIPEDAFVDLRVFDILGKEVFVIKNEYQKAGTYNIVFDGSSLASGVYFYRLNAVGNTKKFSAVRKLILMK
ncbi:MAG: VWA domain-containing protein [Ignavibacteriales bacterium]|nr:MAG: VWA domain-containing protein [Ignavibacteriales bacterium]